MICFYARKNETLLAVIGMFLSGQRSSLPEERLPERFCAPPRLLLETDIGELLPGGVRHDEGGANPRQTRAAGSGEGRRR
jgi:hypothetical protein